MDAASERTLAMAPLAAWSVSDVAGWLHGLELSDHADAFVRSAIDGPLLAELTPDDLATLGVRNKFHARKILQRRDRLAGAAPSGVIAAAAGGAGLRGGAAASGAAQRDTWQRPPGGASGREDAASQWGGAVAATPPASPSAMAARGVPPATPLLRPASPPPSPPPLLLPPGALSHAHQARGGIMRARCLRRIRHTHAHTRTPCFWRRARTAFARTHGSISSR
jgi:hypothetical protein